MTDPIQLAETRKPTPQKPLSPVLLGHWPSDSAEAKAAQAEITELSVSADPNWIAAATVSILTAHYFVSALPKAVAKQLGQDWINELEEYPQWAIENAFRWWLSKDNPKRRNRPVPGDISEQADFAISIIRAAKVRLRQFERYGDNPPAFLKK